MRAKEKFFQDINSTILRKIIILGFFSSLKLIQMHYITEKKISSMESTSFVYVLGWIVDHFFLQTVLFGREINNNKKVVLKISQIEVSLCPHLLHCLVDNLI